MIDLLIGAAVVGLILFCTRWDWKWMMFKPNPRRYIPTREELDNDNKDWS